jgi:hypothetical protein
VGCYTALDFAWNCCVYPTSLVQRELERSAPVGRPCRNRQTKKGNSPFPSLISPEPLADSGLAFVFQRPRNLSRPIGGHDEKRCVIVRWTARTVLRVSHRMWGSGPTEVSYLLMAYFSCLSERYIERTGWSRSTVPQGSGLRKYL